MSWNAHSTRDAAAEWIEPEANVPSLLQRQLLFRSTVMMASAGFLWGLIYYLFGELQAALIPSAYAVLSFINLAILKKPSHYKALRSSQLLLSLLLPFLLMWSLGGMVNSSAVVLWSFTSPMGALVFAGRRQAVLWFAAFCLLVVISAFINYPDVTPTNNLPISMIVIFFVMNLIGVSTVAFVLIRYFVVQSGIAYELLDKEREKTEQLVENMLPASIATRLKETDDTIAERIEGVTVVFADIVGFTPFAMKHPPEAVVSLLDELFSGFDRIASEHGLEKIKTIGDAYMVCGGLEGEGQGTRRSAAFAFEAQALMARIAKERGDDLHMRIGIHRGAVVAGVIGVAKYSYDVWGDTVNVASRLQTNAPPDGIMISREVRQVLGDTHTYVPQGETTLKGHAPVETFLLKAKT